MLANHFQRIGKNEKAKEIFQKILILDPKDAQANIALASSNNREESNAIFLSTLKPIFQQEDVDIDLKIKEMIPYIQKVANTGNKKLADAVIELAQILTDVHPNNAKSFSVYGDLLNHSERPKEALVKYMQTLKLDNSVFTVWEQVMYLNLELNDFDALLKTSNEALDLFPNKAKAYYLNGIANSEKRNYTDAIDGFLARKLQITSPRGSQLDSFGDQITLVIGLIGLFYFENNFMKSNLVLIIIAFIPYIIQMAVACSKYGKATAFHTYLAKLSAIIQSAFILWSLFFSPEYSLFYIMIAVGLLETFEEITLIFRYDEWASDVKGIYWAYKDKRRLKKYTK